MNFKNKIIILVSALVLAGLAFGGYYFFWKEGKETKKIESIAVSFHEAEAEAVSSAASFDQGSLLLYSERVVNGFDQNKDNKYQTNFYMTDLKGEKKYKFYSAQDLTYEAAYPYLKDNVIILTEFGAKNNRVVNLKGEVEKNVLIPPVDFGSDFAVSEDKKFVAFLESKNAEDINSGYLIKIKNLEAGTTQEFEPQEIKHAEVEFIQYLPLDFSQDDKILYLFASGFSQDEASQNPSGLYALNLESRAVDELYFSSPEEQADKDRVVLLGVYPALNLALVNRGSAIVENGSEVFRTQLERLDLTTKEFSVIFTDEADDFAGTAGKILSPDGKIIILLNETNYDKGLRYYNLESGETKKITDTGEFVAWTDACATVIYQVIKEADENAGTGSVELHTLNLATGDDYKIYRQSVLSEGTGLNQEGDTFYTYIGLSN